MSGYQYTTTPEGALWRWRVFQLNDYVTSGTAKTQAEARAKARQYIKEKRTVNEAPPTP